MGALKAIATDSTPFELETIQHINERRAKEVDQFFSATQLQVAEWLLRDTELSLTPKED